MLRLRHIIKRQYPPTRCPALTRRNYTIRAVVSLRYMRGMIGPKAFDVKTQVGDRTGPVVGNTNLYMCPLAFSGIPRHHDYVLGVGFQLVLPILIKCQDQTERNDQPTWITKASPQQREG